MKGYIWVNVSDEMREALYGFLTERTNFIKDFDKKQLPQYKKTRKCWFGGTEEYYDLTKVVTPSGVFMWDTSPHTTGWLDSLHNSVPILTSDKVFLDEEAVSGLMSAIPNEFEEVNK